MASGVSNAPGTRTTSMSPAATPCFSNVPTAASSNRSTMKSLKRDATIPKRKPRALKSPSSVLIRSSMSVFPLGVRNVLDDLEPEPRQPVHLLRRPDDAHAAHTQRAHDLRADAERAEIHAAMPPRAELLLQWRLRQRLHGAHEVARRFLGAQDDGDAVVRLGDQLQRVAQRPVQRRSVQPKHVAQRVLPMHSNESRRFCVERAAREREVHGTIDVILEADEPERTEFGLDLRLADDLDGFLLAQAVLDEIGDRADLELMAPRELREVVAARHGAVVVQDLDDDSCRLEARETREVAAGFRVPRARQNPAGLSHQRKNVPRLPQITRLRLRRNSGLDRARSVVRRDAGRDTLGRFDRDREVRRLANVGVADHQRQAELLATRSG